MGCYGYLNLCHALDRPNQHQTFLRMFVLAKQNENEII